MIIRCYAVLDSKIADFHLAIFDIKDEGAIRQFSDVVNDKQMKWSKHPEDYSLWFVGKFDTSKGIMSGESPVNLINAVSILAVTGGGQLGLFDDKEVKVVS